MHPPFTARPLVAPVSFDGDELACVRAARDRDLTAFEHLYRRHVGRVYAIILRITANPRQAEELTQTCWLQAWQKLPFFREESQFTTWLNRIAVTTVLMDFRSHRRREARIIGLPDLEAVDQGSSPAPSGIRLDLEQAIAALPRQARAVFVLHDIEGYTHEEIAALMELQPGTTKAQLHRARQLLKEALQ